MPKQLTFEKVSADQAQEMRKDIMGPNGSMVKAGPLLTADADSDMTKGSSWDKETRSAQFVMSAEAQDRMGDIVVQEGLDTTQFVKNPQGLLFHNSRSWPIGSWKDVNKNLTGRPKRTEGTLKLLPEGVEETADRAARHIQHGTMKSVSIGFNVNWEAVETIRDGDGYLVGFRFLESELLECSLVPIPAMQLALMKSAPHVLAREHKEMIESILDTYAMDPVTKQLITRADLEAAHKAAAGPTPTFLYLGDLTDQQKASLSKAISESKPQPLQIAAGELILRAPVADVRAVEADLDKRLREAGFHEAIEKSTDNSGIWDRVKSALGFINKDADGLVPQDPAPEAAKAEESAAEEPAVDENAASSEERAQEISPEERAAMENRVKAALERVKVKTKEVA